MGAFSFRLCAIAWPGIHTRSMTSHHTVFIVDDSPSMRARLVELLEDIGSVDVVGEAGTPADAIAGIMRTHPECVLLDYQLEGGTGLEVLRAVHPQAADIAFVVLTNHAWAPYREACLGAGARFFLDKSTEFGSIKDVIAGLEAAPQ